MENRYFGFSVDPSFQGVNRLFVLSLKDENGQESYKQYYLKNIKNIKKEISSIKRSGITLTNNNSIWFKFKQEIAGQTGITLTDNNSIWFKFKQEIAGQTGNGGKTNVEIMVPSKYLSHFWRTIEMPLINCEISLQLKWSKDYF